VRVEGQIEAADRANMNFALAATRLEDSLWKSTGFAPRAKLQSIAHVG
jgi:hypothetical protein